MRFARRCIENEWETLEVSKQEVEKIRKKTVKEIKKVMELIRKEFPKADDSVYTVLLDKLAPNYNSILDDYVDMQLKKREEK